MYGLSSAIASLPNRCVETIPQAAIRGCAVYLTWLSVDLERHIRPLEKVVVLDD